MSLTNTSVRAERPRVTLQSIAKRLAVSTATVSLALRDAPVVAEATRQKVQEIARSMGYVYNRSAAGLRTARSNVLAVGLHDISTPFFSEMLLAIEETALAQGRTIMLGAYTEDAQRQDRVLSMLREYHPDGMIFCPTAHSHVDAFEHLIAAGIPLVQVAREIADAGLDFVGTDDAMSMRLAVQHLAEIGHCRIASIGGTKETSTGLLRQAAFEQAVRDFGLTVKPEWILEGKGSFDTGRAGIQRVLSGAEQPTAAVCANDSVAFGVLNGLRTLGREAGKDFSVVGSDDVAEAAQAYPALTTVRNRHNEMGQHAVNILIKRIMGTADEAVERIILEPTLVVRGTTAPVK
jgi:LacI family transcriptional regulator